MENEIETIIRDKKLLLVNKNAKSYIEELEEDNYCYHNLIKMQNKREFRSKFLKEFQEEKGNNWYPDFDEIYKRYDKLKQENLKLKEDKKKAIEYIKERFDGEVFIHTFDKCNMKELLEILGDKENE